MKLSPRPNPRIVALLVVLIFLISTAVIVTDKFSPRDRHPNESPATASGPATTQAK